MGLGQHGRLEALTLPHSFSSLKLQKAAGLGVTGNETHWRLPRQPQIAEPTNKRATTINTLVITFPSGPLGGNQRFAGRRPLVPALRTAGHKAASRAPELGQTEVPRARSRLSRETTHHRRQWM